MKNFLVVSLVIWLVSNGIAADQHGAPAESSLRVHEWGVFRVNEDADFANADLRALWDDLPEFAYGHIKGRLIPRHWGAVEIRKNPVIFFHATRPEQIQLQIDFPGGMPGVWFPATEMPAVFGFENQPKIGSSLVWNLAIKECPNGWRPKSPAPAEVSNKHWVSHLREVKADEIFARFSPNPSDVEREKFVYYDGLFPQGRWLKITLAGDRMALTSQVKHPVDDVTVVDRRGDKVRIGRVAQLEPGATVGSVTFEEVEASRFAQQATDTLVKQLVGADLFDDEARSLVQTWRKDLFETPGLSVFYRLPPGEYDARLPLTIKPKPASVVRVGLVYQGHLEPDFAERILEQVKQLDSPKFARRDAAMKELLAIGPAALVQLQRLRERRDLSVEVRERLETIIKQWSAKEAFGQ